MIISLLQSYDKQTIIPYRYPSKKYLYRAICISKTYHYSSYTRRKSLVTKDIAMIVSPIADPSSVAFATMAEHLTEKKILPLLSPESKKTKPHRLGLSKKKVNFAPRHPPENPTV